MKNDIKGMIVKEEWTEVPNIVKEEIKTYFKSQFEEKENMKINLDGVPFPMISKEDDT